MNILHKILVSMIPAVPKSIVGKFAKRYVAGETLKEALETVKELNELGASCALDILGEHITSREEAGDTVKQYLKVLEEINARNLDSRISLKPTQLGLEAGFEECLKNTEKIVEKASEFGNFVRIDMESSEYTDDTLKLYSKLRDKFDNVGTVLQAYLRRSIEDAMNFPSDKGDFRICKGIYDEPKKIAYKDMKLINKNYVFLMEEMIENGNFVGIATHDEEIIWEGMRLIHKYNLSKKRYEFQMLLGVDARLRDRIISEGHPLRIYVPYGELWYDYSIRRLKENPKIALYILKNLFR